MRQEHGLRCLRLPNLNRPADIYLIKPPRCGPIEEHGDAVNLIIMLALREGEYFEEKRVEPLGLRWQMNEAGFDHG